MDKFKDTMRQLTKEDTEQYGISTFEFIPDEQVRCLMYLYFLHQKTELFLQEVQTGYMNEAVYEFLTGEPVVDKSLKSQGEFYDEYYHVIELILSYNQERYYLRFVDGYTHRGVPLEELGFEFDWGNLKIVHKTYIETAYFD